MGTYFDSKLFNPDAFAAYVDRIPNVVKTELVRSGAVGTNAAARTALSTQTGSLSAHIPYFGLISGSTSQNNNGATNITSTNTSTSRFTIPHWSHRTTTLALLFKNVGNLRANRQSIRIPTIK